MSKITIPLKKYKKSSIDLAEKSFDPKLRGDWIGKWEITGLYTSTYIAEKYKNILHIVPFTEFSVFYDVEINKTLLKLTDFSTLKWFFSGKDSFEPYLKKYRNTNKRFTFYPMTIAELNDAKDGLDYHGISALYDKKSNKIEIFDSIGSDFSRYTKTFRDLFVEIYGTEVKIVYIVDRCVAFGKLEYERCYGPMKPSYNYNAGGFCAIWVFWFLELRLLNPSISKEKLIEKALKRLKNGKKVCELLRGYAQFVDKIFSKYSLQKTTTNLIIKQKDKKKSPDFTKKEYSYLYIILAAIFGSAVAVRFIQRNKKKLIF